MTEKLLIFVYGPTCWILLNSWFSDKHEAFLQRTRPNAIIHFLLKLQLLNYTQNIYECHFAFLAIKEFKKKKKEKKSKKNPFLFHSFKIIIFILALRFALSNPVEVTLKGERHAFWTGVEKDFFWWNEVFDFRAMLAIWAHLLLWIPTWVASQFVSL